jgi:hypothetical protein
VHAEGPDLKVGYSSFQPTSAARRASPTLRPGRGAVVRTNHPAVSVSARRELPNEVTSREVLEVQATDHVRDHVGGAIV